MAHIAVVTGLLSGRIHSSFELTSRLEAEGHRITYLCQPSTQQKIELNGFKCVPVSEITFDYHDPRGKNIKSSWGDKFLFHFKHLRSHYSVGEKILKLEEHKKLLQGVNPDLILVDVEIHDLIFTAVELKIPVKLTTTWFSDKISINSPSVRTKVIPGVGFSGSKLGILLSWIFMRLKINGRVLINRFTFENYRRWMFKKYANKIGFDTGGLLVNTLPPLYSFTKLPIASMTMSELEFPHKLAKNIVYVGPMVQENRVDKTVVSSLRDELGSIYQTKIEENKKLIYCSVGSLAKGHSPFLRKVIDAVSKEKDWTMILSIGPKMKSTDFGAIPKNIHLFNWVPQLEVIEKSDCCITHCGINSINECIHYKVPMLLYSSGFTDEDGNAARMAYHELGIRGNTFLDSEEQINQNLKRILQEEVFSENLKRFNQIYQKYQQRELSSLLLGL